jgi:hypothetical protein
MGWMLIVGNLKYAKDIGVIKKPLKYMKGFSLIFGCGDRI